MYLEPLENTEIVREYDEAKDVYFVKAKSTPLYLHADQYNFFVFFPEDAHGPGIEAGTLTPVKKAIVKIRIE
jgi:YhcH/YjgK/YiaL family protein